MSNTSETSGEKADRFADRATPAAPTRCLSSAHPQQTKGKDKPRAKRPSPPKPFASSPLITRERLSNCADEDGLDALFSPAPAWVLMCKSVGPETLPNEAKMVLRVGRKHKREYALSAVSLAILYELTRYGNSAATNINRPAGSKAARVYLKLTFKGAAKNNQPAHRIVAGVGLHQQALYPKATPGGLIDLHPDNLAIDGGGKPEKNARKVAMSHAERCARAYASEADAVAYLANLNALLAFHDEVFGLEPL